MVDAVDSKSTSSNRVQVRVLSPAKNPIFCRRSNPPARVASGLEDEGNVFAGQKLPESAAPEVG